MSSGLAVRWPRAHGGLFSVAATMTQSWLPNPSRQLRRGWEVIRRDAIDGGVRADGAPDLRSRALGITYEDLSRGSGWPTSPTGSNFGELLQGDPRALLTTWRRAPRKGRRGTSC